MPRTILDAIASETRPPPPAAAPGAVVYHSYEELQATRPAVNESFRPILSTIVEGTICTIRKDRTQVVAAYSPPLNALCLPHYMSRIYADAVNYTPDHTFSRREPQEGDGTGRGPVKQAYAMCQGCFDRGWHREETDVSAIAFGLDPSTLGEYPPPRPPGVPDMSACLKQPGDAPKADT